MVIKVIIDTRESDVWDLLKEYNTNDGTRPWYVVKAPLHVGDIAYYNDEEEIPLAIFERKTVDDLAASQKDGRYREQRNRLLAMRGANKTAIGYIIEAPPLSEKMDLVWGRSGEFKEFHLLQTILRLQFRYTIPVFSSISVINTIEWIKRTAVLLALDNTVFQTGVATDVAGAAAAYGEAIHIKKADNNSPEKIFMSFLLAIPGLGAKSAKAIADHVKHSFTHLFALSVHELSEIKNGKKRIGKIMATAIHTALHT